MNVVFFGDSICFGEYVSVHRGWIPQLSEDVAAAFGDRVVVINSSINGNTTRMALERMPADVQNYRPGIVVVQFGMNDCNLWQTDEGLPRVSPPAFRANLDEILDRAHHFGARTTILNTNHPSLREGPFPHRPIAYEDGNRHYNGIIREIAKDRKDTVLVDMEAAFRHSMREGTPLQSLLLDDQLHLSPAGHDLYRLTMKPVLLDAIVRWHDGPTR